MYPGTCEPKRSIEKWSKRFFFQFGYAKSNMRMFRECDSCDIQ